MPMGGLGTRTSDMYIAPKPFINIYGKYLFEYALEGLKDSSYTMKTKLTVICREEILNPQYIKHINQIGWKFADEFNLIQIDKLTRGALETVMKAKNLIEDDDIVIVLDCDLIYKCDDLYNILERIDESEDIDGFLLSFNSTEPRYSYAEIDENNIVKRTAEKNPISEHALAGVYGFSSGELLKKYAEVILSKPLDEFDKNEYYVSYIYNLMIQDGARIVLTYLDEYTSIGTSEEIDNFKNSDNKFKSLYITDFDGTLVDTREANYLSYKEVFKKIYNYDLTEQDYYNNFGLRINELLETLKLDVDKMSDVKKMKARVYKKYFDKININMGLVTMLYHKKQSGHIVALATTASKKNVENVLNYFEIADLFDYIITGENVKNGKPNPEVYNKVMDNYSYIKSSNVTIFEDSDVGLLAAHHSMVNDNNIVNITKWPNTQMSIFVSHDTFVNKRQSKTITL